MIREAINIQPFIKKYGSADFLKRVCESYTFCIWKYKKNETLYSIEEAIIKNDLYKDFTEIRAEESEATIYIVSFDDQFLYFSEDLFKEYFPLMKILRTII